MTLCTWNEVASSIWQEQTASWLGSERTRLWYVPPASGYRYSNIWTVGGCTPSQSSAVIDHSNIWTVSGFGSKFSHWLTIVKKNIKIILNYRNNVQTAFNIYCENGFCIHLNHFVGNISIGQVVIRKGKTDNSSLSGIDPGLTTTGRHCTMWCSLNWRTESTYNEK